MITKNLELPLFFSKSSQKYQKLIFIISTIVILLSIIGISRLEVENSFINYFSKKTEIYKGMKLIDEKLGGTTPLEVILKFPKNKTETNDDEFEDWENENNEEDEKKYWFTKDKIDKIASVHNYLDGLPEIGKVLSFSSIIDEKDKTLPTSGRLSK